MQDSLPSGSGAILEEVSSGPSRRETRTEELKLTCSCSVRGCTCARIFYRGAFSAEVWVPAAPGLFPPSQGLHRISGPALCVLMEHQCTQRFGR